MRERGFRKIELSRLRSGVVAFLTKFMGVETEPAKAIASETISILKDAKPRPGNPQAFCLNKAIALTLNYRCERLIRFFEKRFDFDTATAEDLASDVVERVWLCGDLPLESPNAFVWAIATNRGVDHVREYERRRKAIAEAGRETNPQSVAELAPLDQVILREAYNALPLLDRKVLALRAAGFTHKEIAEVLGTTPSAVRKRYSRLRRHLRKTAAEQRSSAELTVEK